MGAQGPDPDSAAATASEQKLQQYRRRRSEVLHQEPHAARSRRRPPDDPRQQIEGLLDPGSFVELDMFASGAAAGDAGERRVAGDGVAGGFGTVDGRQVAVYAQDPAVLGGLLGAAGAEKIVKVQDLALLTRIPIVGFHVSMGAREEEGLPALAGLAAVAARGARSSGVVPQIGVLAGPCRGHGLRLPALADFLFAPEGWTCEVDLDRLAHFRPRTDAECLAGVRELLSYLPSSSGDPAPVEDATGGDEAAAWALQTVVPEDSALAYDVRGVVERVLDGGRFLEVQPFHAANLVAGFGRLAGSPVGLVANQPAVGEGTIDAEASAKAARFVRFCDAFDLPVVTLVDTPGQRAAPAEAVREGALLLAAYAEATVPKLTVVLRRGLRDASPTMAPRQLGADLNLAWPAAQSAYEAAERGYVDDVIEPRLTRPALVRALELCRRKRVDAPGRRCG